MYSKGIFSPSLAYFNWRSSACVSLSSSITAKREIQSIIIIKHKITKMQMNFFIQLDWLACRNKKVFFSKGIVKEIKIISETTARVWLSYLDIFSFKSLSADNETKIEYTESLVGKFSWWKLHHVYQVINDILENIYKYKMVILFLNCFYTLTTHFDWKNKQYITSVQKYN